MPRTPARLVLALLVLTAVCCSRGKGAAEAKATPSPTLDPARPLPSPLPEIVARVNGSPISIRQVLPIAKAALDRVSLPQRDKKLPEVLRQAVGQYVARELLLQEALARGISADKRAVDWAYDQARREHPDDASWKAFLAEQGSEPQSFRDELRIQRTVAALIDEELRSFTLPEAELRQVFEANPGRFGPAGGPAPAFESVRREVQAAVRRERADEIVSSLVARLQSKARIELLL
jgi:hypothetical protein